MSDLQDALDRVSVGLSEDGYPVISGGTSRQLKLLMDAARLVANRNYEAAGEFLWDESIGWNGPETQAEAQDVASRIVAAALTSGDTK